jgi:hypothetical protein
MREFVYIRPDGEPTQEVKLNELLLVADKRLQKGDGPFQLIVDGEKVGAPKKRAEHLAQLARRLELGSVGPTFRSRDRDGQVVFTCREVKRAADVINTSGNEKADLYWTLLKAEFPQITFLGSLVCKPDSQHRFGNALDVGFGSRKLGEEIWTFSLDNRRKYDLRNLIIFERIWHLGEVSHYTGQPHVTHTHGDFNPTFDYDLACGLRG